MKKKRTKKMNAEWAHTRKHKSSSQYKWSVHIKQTLIARLTAQPKCSKFYWSALSSMRYFALAATVCVCVFVCFVCNCFHIFLFNLYSMFCSVLLRFYSSVFLIERMNIYMSSAAFAFHDLFWCQPFNNILQQFRQFLERICKADTDARTHNPMASH